MPVQYRGTIDDAWRRLRTLRHNPPEHAVRGGRRDTFAAALEQAEQFFRAADAVGYETKPVMLYYGLSQASQAILAAKRDPKAGQQPATSHGTDCPNRNQIAVVGDLEVSESRGSGGGAPTGGAFQLLAGVLNSPTLPGPVGLRQLAIALPEGVEVPPTGTAEMFGAALLERHDGQDFQSLVRETTGRVAKLAHLPLRLMSADVADVERELVEHYPALDGFHVIPDRQCPEIPHIVLLLDPPGLRLSLSYHRGGRPTPNEMFGMARLGPETYMDFKDGRLRIPPTLPGNSAPLHPLMTWYAVLFGLSEMARYQPTKWADAININRSADATALEHLMDTAHLACVNLIVDLFAIDRPSPEHEEEARKRGDRIRAWTLQQQQVRG
jgi:hypothetical protein